MGAVQLFLADNNRPQVEGIQVSNLNKKNVSLLRAYAKSGKAPAKFIEVMACPNGCIGGGGQPPACNKRKAERAEAIFKADEACALRIPQQNPDLGYVYDNLLQGRAHELLHIHYPAHGGHA